MITNNISVCVITFNEEKNIGDCLRSVKWAKEVIVLDSFSADRTVEIAKEFGASVFSAPWESFSKSKNLCVEKASNEWVFVIDADERMTPELKDEICSLDGGADGYNVGRKNYFLGKWIRFCGWYPDSSIRLFRKGKGYFKDREVHEAVSVDGKTAILKNHLIHYTYTGMDQFIQRQNRYSTLAAQEMAKKRESCGRAAIFIQANLIARPVFTFLKMYFLKLGFLDGMRGFLISFFHSYYVFLKYSKLWEMKGKDGAGA